MEKLDTYILFEIDEYGEVDVLRAFPTLEKAKEKGETVKTHAHILCVPRVDLNNDLTLINEWKSTVAYKPFECVWSNYDEDEPLENL